MRNRGTSSRLVYILVAGLLAIFALAGCAQVDVSSEFERDGSARHALSTTVDRSMIEDEMLEGELDFTEIEQRASELEGFEVERIDSDQRVGVRVSTRVDDNEDLGAALNGLFNAMEPESGQVQPFTGSFTDSGSGITGTTYHFELTVDGDVLFADSSSELDDEMAMEIDPTMMRQFIDLTYTVSMPGELSDHDGIEVGNDQVQWELPFEGSSTFTAQSKEDGGASLMLMIGVGTGSLALALLAVGGLFMLRSRSAQPRPPVPTERSTAD